MKRETHTIDASNKVLGRLATRIALLLQGKNNPDFEPHRDMGSIVIVKNVDKIRVTGKKADQKKYFHHSGYLGGLKEEPFQKAFDRSPALVLKRAVWGMLPKNKLRSQRIKRLKFE
jgi:large subunit ribosomal protein L13